MTLVRVLRWQLTTYMDGERLGARGLLAAVGLTGDAHLCHLTIVTPPRIFSTLKLDISFSFQKESTSLLRGRLQRQ